MAGLDRPIRVLTANIWNYAGPYERRMKLLRTQIAELAPDLIAFQEAGWRSEKDHQVQELLAGTEYALDHEAGGCGGKRERLYDVAVASRWPMKRHAFWILSGSGRALAEEVTAPAPVGRFLFISTFGTNRWQFDAEARREQGALALDAQVRAAADRQGFPPIVAGDFDAAPEAACIRFLTGRQSLGGRSTHYVDAWEAAGNPSPGYTWTTANAFTRETTREIWRLAEHHRRIDYVFLGSPHHYAGYARVVSCRVALDRPEGTIWPSDHLGVMAEIASHPESDSGSHVPPAKPGA